MSAPLPQGGTGRVGIVENWELRHAKRQDANSGAFKGLLFVVVALLLITVGGWFAARPMVGPVLTDAFEEYPGLIDYPVVSDLIATEFADRVDKPAGPTTQKIKFVIADTDGIDEVRTNLVDAGLLNDEPAFMYAIMRDRVDQLIKPGTYTMGRDITPAGIATRLEGDPDPPTPRLALDMRHGRRIEQHVAYLQQETEEAGLQLDPKEFLKLARSPSKTLRTQYKFLQQVPEGNSLEGFLFGGTYEVPVDITAEELINMMLARWERDAGAFAAQARKQGIDFYDMLTVASLVEREAKADSDRRKIAGVYWNRLDPKVNKQTGGLMQADPTVVYATDSMTLEDRSVKDWDEYLFWDLLGVSDYATVAVDPKYASFQTYQNVGLPDWPIVTPSAASIQAALSPATKSKLLYFYACEGSDTHSFARTLRQHQNNIAKCQ